MGGIGGTNYHDWGYCLKSQKKKSTPENGRGGVLIHALGVVLKMRYCIKHINDIKYSEKLKETMQNVTIVIKNTSSRRRREKFLGFPLRI